MPKSRVSRRAKLKKAKTKKAVNDRDFRINELEQMYADLEVHQAAAIEVERMKEMGELDLEHSPGEGDEGRSS